MMAVLQIGAGGVGWVVAHKLSQHNQLFGDITIASRSVHKGQKIIESILRKKNKQTNAHALNAVALNACDINALKALIVQIKPHLVINVGPPQLNPFIMRACAEEGVAYLDTSVTVDLVSKGQQVPDAYADQWALDAAFKAVNRPAFLGSGFDPGVVNVFAAYAKKHWFDEVHTLDILDVNAGNHGRKFATNFDPETNLLEILGDSFYYEYGRWQQVPHHTRKMTFDFPEVGSFTLYSMAHDEVRSLAEYFPAKQRIEFWMSFGETYLRYFNVLKDLGFLTRNAVTTQEGISVAPISVLKALLPAPESLAAGYTGKTVIGNVMTGIKDGRRRALFVYNVCVHEACYHEVESQAISYTTGVPVVATAMLYFNKIWQSAGVHNLEQLDPDAFMQLLPRLGLTWHVQELSADFLPAIEYMPSSSSPAA